MRKAARLSVLLKRAENYQRPVFPLQGGDVIAAGIPAGKRVGEILKSLEDFWVERNFVPEREAMLERLKAAVAGEV